MELVEEVIMFLANNYQTKQHYQKEVKRNCPIQTQNNLKTISKNSTTNYQN